MRRLTKNKYIKKFFGVLWKQVAKSLFFLLGQDDERNASIMIKQKWQNFEKDAAEETVNDGVCACNLPFIS